MLVAKACQHAGHRDPYMLHKPLVTDCTKAVTKKTLHEQLQQAITSPDVTQGFRTPGRLCSATFVAPADCFFVARHCQGTRPAPLEAPTATDALGGIGLPCGCSLPPAHLQVPPPVPQTTGAHLLKRSHHHRRFSVP